MNWIGLSISPFFGIAVGLAGLAASQNAFAQTLAPGSTITPTQEFTGDPGTLLASVTTTTTATSFGPDVLTFTARSAVYETATGTLDFYYQVFNNPSSTDSIGRFTAADFTGYSANVYYQPGDSGGGGSAGFTDGNKIPITADRSGSGSVIGFNFDPPPAGNGKLMAGATSDTMIVVTNATAYQPGDFAVTDGVATTVEGFAPASPPSSVPEPAALAVLCPGLLGFLAYSRRRH